jgi:hypothetical protein
MEAFDQSAHNEKQAAPARSTHVEEFYTRLEEIGMGDIEFQHARPANIAVAQRAVYFVGKRFCAVTLEREREYTERVSGNLLPGEGLTYVLLIRSGEKDDGNGRTFYVAQHADLLDDLPQLVEEHGFEFTAIRSDSLLEELSDKYTATFDTD